MFIFSKHVIWVSLKQDLEVFLAKMLEEDDHLKHMLEGLLRYLKSCTARVDRVPIKDNDSERNSRFLRI